MNNLVFIVTYCGGNLLKIFSFGSIPNINPPIDYPYRFTIADFFNLNTATVNQLTSIGSFQNSGNQIPANQALGMTGDPDEETGDIAFVVDGNSIQTSLVPNTPITGSVELEIIIPNNDPIGPHLPDVQSEGVIRWGMNTKDSIDMGKWYFVQC